MLNQNFLEDLEDDDLIDDQNNEDQKMRAEVDDAVQDFQASFFGERKETSILLKDQIFQNHFEKVLSYLKRSLDDYVGSIEVGHEEYSLILKSNEYGSIIDKEIHNVHKSLKDLYQKRFPELEQIVLNPVDYTKIVIMMKSEVDLSKIDLSAILTGHQMMAVNVAASSTVGLPLTEDQQNKVNTICDEIIKLDYYHQQLLQYIESRMKFIAPNLSALVGTQLASKLMTAAGGVDKLATMPACNIQVMGGQKKSMLGFNRGMQDRNRGLFATLDMVQKGPPKYQTQLIRMLSTNVSKVARIDAMRTCPRGTAGESIKEKMLQRYEKIQEAPPPKINKPIEPPDERPKKKRGGKRHRKDKERLAQTELRKYQNRLKFGAEGEAEYRETGIGIGMLSQGIGKVKLRINKAQKIALSKFLPQRVAKKQQQRMTQLQTHSGSTGGLTSSIVFTSVQGMELINPELNKVFQKKPDQYFNRGSGFKSVIEEKKKV